MKLPQEIDVIVDAYSLNEVHIGKSKSRVFELMGRAEEKYFLKVCDSSYVAQEIEREIKILTWLSEQKIPAPKKVALVHNDEQWYFLMTAVPGQSLAEVALKLGSSECIRLAAEFLRTLHSLNIEACPFNRELKITRKLAYANLENGLVDESDFDLENQGKSAKQIFQELNQEIKEDLVFTHGDYCFPNIIYSKGTISGVVDLGRAGIADRYQDIGLFLRSFKTNIAEPDTKLFLANYRLITQLDEQKLAFYKKLDEFF